MSCFPSITYFCFGTRVLLVSSSTFKVKKNEWELKLDNESDSDTKSSGSTSNYDPETDQSAGVSNDDEQNNLVPSTSENVTIQSGSRGRVRVNRGVRGWAATKTADIDADVPQQASKTLSYNQESIV